MTHFVLVHSPLAGPLTWSKVAASLVERGHDVSVPRLRSDHRPFWHDYVDQVAAEIEEIDAPVVLVGHSGAGPLLPVIGNATGGTEAYLFVDAILPRADTSSLASMHPALRAKLSALAAEGMLPPWHCWWEPEQLVELIPDPGLREAFISELLPVPLALLDEVVPEVDDWPDGPCAYLRLSAAYELEEAHAARAGWAVSRMEGRHLDVLTRPDEVASRLLALLVRLGVGS